MSSGTSLSAKRLSGTKMLRLFFILFQWIYSKTLSIIYRTPNTTPSMTNSILIESATVLANRIRNQKVTSVEVVRSYINRIQAIDKILNCIADTRFEEALSEAEKIDELIRSGVKSAEELETETPFLGVPFTVPDSVPVKGLLNTFGLSSRRDVRADGDADSVALMKEGGAIPLASTNVSESCLSCETHNPVTGRTCNPYDTNRSVGGPYGGEGCLIASSGSPMGISPSVRLPSAFNGIFGHRPSSNVTKDAVGPMSRNSADLLPALKILTKNSKVDLNLDKPVDVKKLKYYFMYDGASNEEINKAIQKAADYFRNSHKASVVQMEVKALKKILPVWKLSTYSEASVQPKPHVGKELVKALFGKSPHGVLFLLTTLIERKVHSGTDLNQAKEELSAELQDILGSDGVFIFPTHPTAAYRHNESLIKGFDLGYVAIFDALGLPATHCPVGLDSNDLPIGFQVIAALNGDRLTMAVAQEIEKAFGGWKPPPSHETEKRSRHQMAVF